MDKRLPLKSLEPPVFLDLINPENPQSVLGLPLDHFIHEIGCVQRPARGDVSRLYMHLF